MFYEGPVGFMEGLKVNEGSIRIMVVLCMKVMGVL